VTLPGNDPAKGGTTLIPTVPVPVQLQFVSTGPREDRGAERDGQLAAGASVARVLKRGIWSGPQLHGYAPGGHATHTATPKSGDK